MAVFTAAAVAIGAAVATTTAATVAAAVVTTSIAIGVAGLAVTAVGMVTKNDDLLKAGKIMGYVGMAGGLAGGAIGGFGAMANGGGFLQGAGQAFTDASMHISNSWNNGVGSLFNAGDAGAVAAPAGQTGATAQPGVLNAPTQTAVDNQALSAVGQNNTTPFINPSAPSTAVGAAPPAPAPSAAAVATPSPVSVSAPVTPIAPSAGVQPGLFSEGIGGAATEAAKKTAETTLPDWIKMSALTTGAQGLSGAAAGWYQGASAEEKLEFDRLQAQRAQNQVDLLNRNNAYAPILQFRGGR